MFFHFEPASGDLALKYFLLIGRGSSPNQSEGLPTLAEHSQQFLDAQTFASIEASLPSFQLWNELWDYPSKEYCIVQIIVEKPYIFPIENFNAGLLVSMAGAPQARGACDLPSGKSSTKRGAISEGMVGAAGR